MDNTITEVYINGARVNDAASLIDTAATVLAGVTVNWGRTSPLDQPAAATASLVLALPRNQSAALLDQVTPGSPLEIITRYTAPASNLVVIPNSTNLYATGATRSGTTNATLVATSPQTTPINAYTPPGPIQAEGTNPTAWDALGRAGRNARYTLTQTVAVQSGVTASLYPVYYSAPWKSAAIIGPRLGTPSGGTLSASFTVPPEHVGKWVGILVRLDPPAPTWAQRTSLWSAYTSTWEATKTTYITAQQATRLDAGLYDATVFAGRISDTAAQWDNRVRRPILRINAVDLLADLANQKIGDQPWPEEAAQARASRILTFSQNAIGLIFDSARAATLVCRRDVDNQPIKTLLDDVAESTGTILWPAAHQTLGGFIQFEDPAQRPALYSLTLPATGPADLDVKLTGSTRLPAALFERDAARITKQPGEVASIATVRWATVTLDAEGKLHREDSALTATDPTLLAAIGPRALNIATDLVSASEAHARAMRALALAAPAGWNLTGLTWDTSRPASKPLDMLAVLDSTRRIGLPIILSDLPEWIPNAPAAPAYLDGGSYTYTGKDWHLTLTTTKAAYPAASLQWGQAPPALTWARMTALTWNDISLASL